MRAEGQEEQEGPSTGSAWVFHLLLFGFQAWIVGVAAGGWGSQEGTPES